MLAVLQARMSSSRLPGKVMRPILGVPMIGRQIERLRRARGITRIVTATSDHPSDDVLADYAGSLGVAVFRGALDDVLGRFAGALEAEGPAEHLLRLTADCPLADPQVIDRCIDAHLAAGADCTHNSPGNTFPKGLDVEVLRAEVLRTAAREAAAPYDREHVTPFVYARPERFRIAVVRRDPPAPWRWTVDTPQDFAFVTAVYAALHPARPDFDSEDVLAWQDANPGAAIPNPA